MKRPETGRGVMVPIGKPALLHRVRGLEWSLPLGWQLSTLYVLLLAATLTIVGIIVYSQQEAFLVRDMASRLEHEARRVAEIPFFVSSGGELQWPAPGPGNPATPVIRSFTNEQFQARIIDNLVRGLSGPDVTVAIFDTRGGLLAVTMAIEGDSQPVIDSISAQQATSALAVDAPVTWTVGRPDGSRRMIVLMRMVWQVPIVQSGQVVATQAETVLVQQSASLASVDSALERLRLYLLLGALGGTLVGFVLVHLFTRRVLRPLDYVADTADAIANGDIERRLQLPEGRSEVARLGKAFDYMVARLISILESQRRFVADASHELRTPLTSLKGLSEILTIGAHGNDTRVIEQSAGAIYSELERLNRLVNDLLTLSRLDSSDARSAASAMHTEIDLFISIESAVEQVATVASVREVNILYMCERPLLVTGDAGQIKQVLLNLLDNALRYTPLGGQIVVTGTKQNEHAVIEVRDTGTGISERDLPHIFERFYRSDISRTRATGNSGLGLAIAKGIVEAHGGSITSASTPGEGTLFMITFPVSQSLGPQVVSREQIPAHA